MRYRLFYNPVSLGLVALLAAISIGAIAAEVAGTAAALRDGELGIVLLQDGGVLEGQITRAADWYIVGRGGGQLQIAASRVQFVGRSVHEAYEYRLQNATQPTGESHLALAEWCLRYDLATEAEAELATARSIGAGQGRAELVSRRIAAVKVRLAAKAAGPAVQAEQIASAEQSTPPRTLSRDLPDGVVELFTRRVQPILVNNCTASKCHQPGGQQAFQLNRALLRGEANRKTTMQNLAATLALVDRAHPETSPLLTVPRQTHGGMRGPIFAARQEQAFKHVADWVALIAPQKPAEGTANNEPPEVAAAQSTSPAASAALSADNAGRKIDPAVEPAAAVENLPSDSLRRPHRLRYGEMPKPWQPRDEFDPEIFNRAQKRR